MTTLPKEYFDKRMTGIDKRFDAVDSPSTQIGYVNGNGQRNAGHRGVLGTDHSQYAYKVECTRCGYVYGANGSDLHERRCPECQASAQGITYWQRPTMTPAVGKALAPAQVPGLATGRFQLTAFDEGGVADHLIISDWCASSAVAASSRSGPSKFPSATSTQC